MDNIKLYESLWS